MKKFLFVLMVLMVGVLCVNAGPAHPPIPPGLEIALPGYGVNAIAVLPEAIIAPAILPDVVLSTASLRADLKGVLVKVVIDKYPFNIGQMKTWFTQQPDFYLRC